MIPEGSIRESCCNVLLHPLAQNTIKKYKGMYDLESLYPCKQSCFITPNNLLVIEAVYSVGGAYLEYHYIEIPEPFWSFKHGGKC